MEKIKKKTAATKTDYLGGSKTSIKLSSISPHIMVKKSKTFKNIVLLNDYFLGWKQFSAIGFY